MLLILVLIVALVFLAGGGYYGHRSGWYSRGYGPGYGGVGTPGYGVGPGPLNPTGQPNIMGQPTNVLGQPTNVDPPGFVAGDDRPRI